MTTTTTPAVKADPDAPPPLNLAKAAVGFDTNEQKLRVINAEDMADATEKGDVVDVDGHMLTILEFCDSVDAARVSCETHASGMNGMGLSSIKYEQCTDDEAVDDEEAAQETSTSGGDKDIDMADLDDLDMLETTDFAAAAAAGFGGISQLEAIASLQQQIDDMKGAMRDAIAVTMNDLQYDVDRIQKRQETLVQFFQKFLGTDQEGRTVQPFSEKFPSKAFDGSTRLYRKDGDTIQTIVSTHFDQMEKLWTRRNRERTDFVRDGMLGSDLLMGPNAKKQAQKTPSARRTAADSSDGGEQEYTFGTNGTQGKRIVNGIVKEVEKLYYPFITREEEEECLEQANGLAPIYAQLLAKLLFADTIMMYFKDQDTAKRNWLHDAVDYRFPTLDKATHVSKWKNCSFFINKNMREAVLASGTAMPRAPCGPRGPIGPKDKNKSDTKENGEDDSGSTDGDEGDSAMATPQRTKIQPKINRQASLDGIEWDYLEPEYEKECFEECRGDQYKYAELMALRLFSDSLALKFKEQPQQKKDWLRTCVESRFPVEDRERNDQRWKICGQTCNRNRTKIVGADGREEKYPYFDQSVEEECLKRSDGQVTVYAELMNAKLFPDSQHLFFKDQDLGKRNWLHTILDKRFPSSDKVTQTAKWKSCTNAINKKLFDGTVTPITREAVLSSIRDDADSCRRSFGHDETPRASVPRFERRSEAPAINGSQKRKAEDSESAPSAKRESIRNKNKKEKSEQYSAYPYVSEEEEMAIFEASNGNPQVYGRELGRILFADTIKNYFKDQDTEKRQWIHEILDFRFPSKNALESKQKWKNVTAAINRNMTTAVASRRSLPH